MMDYAVAYDLRSALSARLLRITLVSIAVGVCFHACIRNLEIDYRLWRLTAIYAIFVVALIVAYIEICQHSFSLALIKTVLVSASFSTGLAGSIVLYRLLFHRLKNFPGPLGAKISKFYAVSVSAKSLQYHLELENMHREYGDFVRTGSAFS
jgi:hypothetical protein